MADEREKHQRREDKDGVQATKHFTPPPCLLRALPYLRRCPEQTLARARPPTAQIAAPPPGAPARSRGGRGAASRKRSRPPPTPPSGPSPAPENKENIHMQKKKRYMKRNGTTSKARKCGRLQARIEAKRKKNSLRQPRHTRDDTKKLLAREQKS